jgi:biopolymer transport protein ExbD
MSVSDEIQPISGINVTSLVDITMSLLIMFIITVPILNEQKVRSAVNVPVLEDSARSEVLSEQQKHGIIAITREGTILWSLVEGDQEPVFDTVQEPDYLLPYLRNLDENSAVSVEADSLTPYQFVIDCIRVIAKAGINNVDLVYTLTR